MIDLGILILGGGEATRLPGKLALDAGDVPMIARVYRNVNPPLHATEANPHEPMSREHAHREIVISGKSTFARELDALLPVPLVIDRWDRRGPLGGMLASFARMRARFVFVVAGDAPFVDAAFVVRLASAYRAGDEALVPAHAGADGGTQLEPLAAIYDRLAFIRTGIPVLRAGRGKLRIVIDGLRTRFVTVDDARIFANVNTPTDYAALRAQLASQTRGAPR